MAKIVYREMPAPRELSQQIPAPRAKARMQKPQDGGKFVVQIRGGARVGWLWMKLIPALFCKSVYFKLSNLFSNSLKKKLDFNLKMTSHTSDDTFNQEK